MHEITIEIAAPVGLVWKTITDGAEIPRWFAPVARVTPGVGGSIFLSWGEGMEGEAPIAAWEPESRMAWREGGKIVGYELEAIDGNATRLRLTHPGLNDTTSRAWHTFFAMLRYGVETHPGSAYRTAWKMRTVEEPQSACWNKVTAALGIATGEGAPYATNFAGAALEGRVVRHAGEGYLCLSVSEDHSLLAFFIEPGGANMTFATVEWILYGDAAGGSAHATKRIGQFLDATFNGGDSPLP